MDSAQPKTEIAVQSSTPVENNKSWFSPGAMVPIIFEILGLVCVIVWVHMKMKSVSQRIDEIVSRVDEIESVIDRHESVLNKILILLGNNKQRTTPEVVQPTRKEVVDLGSIQSVPLVPLVVPVSQPVIPTITELDLDAELKSEIGELTLN